MGNSRPDADSSPGPRVEEHHRTKGLLRLSMACNERCSFCNVPAEDHAPAAPSAAELDAMLAAFVETGQQTLTISGGEPTLLRRRLLSLVGAARAKGIPFVELQTTAALVDDVYAAELAQAGLTSAFVALLSHESAIHDELMCRPGAHAECLRGIDALLDAGIHVTLNPVITSSMQTLVAPYVDFVAARLARLRSISLSVVQPHGRAAGKLELLPDYAVLSDSVRQARRRAEAHGLDLLNPYCGLPLCAGWEDALDRSVEAVEVEARRAHVGPVPGLDNRGDKRHGPCCRRCALRTRCGGAWHAYWDVRGGSGLGAPLGRLEPWEQGAAAAPGQTIVVARSGVTPRVLQRLAAATTPTVWLTCGPLGRGDAARIDAAGCTDLALTVGSHELGERVDLVRELRQITRRNAERPPQATLRVALAMKATGSFEDCYRSLRLGAAVGVDAIRLRAPAEPRWQRFVGAVRAEWPELDVSLLEDRGS